MKVSLSTGPGGANLYTRACIGVLCGKAGIDVVDEQGADALWVSVCDPDDLPALQHARSVARGRPVIMGGFEGYCGEPYLAWADAVVVGEGKEFIEAWGRSLEEALSLPCVLTANTPVVYPSYAVPWREAPLLKVPGKARYYYLAGRGCAGKCRFCATSWVQPHTSVAVGTLHKVASAVQQFHGTVTFITNDSSEYATWPGVNAQSVRVRDYLRDPERYKARVLHIGIEGWTEATRREWSKPISDSDIAELIDETGRQRQVIELFFIVGYAGWSMADVEHFAATVLPTSTENNPAIWVKMTYFDACPHTPLAKERIAPAYCDTRTAFGMLNSRNKRVRVFPTRSTARSAWRTAFHRATRDQAVVLGRQPTDTNNPASFDRFAARLTQLGLATLLDEQSAEPCAHIQCRYSDPAFSSDTE